MAEVFLSLQGVDRMASVLVLSHPDRDHPQMPNLHLEHYQLSIDAQRSQPGGGMGA